MTVLESSDKVRILQDSKEVYVGYFANLRADTKVLEQFRDMEVEKFRLNLEIRHKQWKERNLMPPMHPDETPNYCFSDLQLTVYHDIYV